LDGDGIETPLSQTSAELVITNTVKSDEGFYECRGSFEKNNVAAFSQVLVRGECSQYEIIIDKITK